MISKHEQLSPRIPDDKGPTNVICYWRIFVIANIGNEKNNLKRLKFSIRYWRISVTLASGVSGLTVAGYLIIGIWLLVIWLFDLNGRNECDMTNNRKDFQRKAQNYSSPSYFCLGA